MVYEPELFEHTCTRCGKKVMVPVRSRGPPPGGIYCGECSTKRSEERKAEHRRDGISYLQKKLLAEEFSLEQEDKKIAQEIADFLDKEGKGRTYADPLGVGTSEIDENLLSSILEKLLKDGRKRRKIIKHILRLQKKK